MDNLLDTLMNIEVLAFIALLFWLYFKPDSSIETKDSQRPES
jgi:hypothetical protein